MTLRRYLLTPFLPRVLRCVNLIKVSNWFEADLQMFLIWWMKFSLLSIHVPESLTFDTALISFWSMFIIWLVCMISFVFIKYYRMKFICIHNHVVIFKVSCKLYDNKYMITSIQITDIEIFAIMDVLVVLVFHGSYWAVKFCF